LSSKTPSREKILSGKSTSNAPFSRFSVFPHRHRHQQPKQKENSKKTSTNKPSAHSLTQTNV
jgi:hypothetical protein